MIRRLYRWASEREARLYRETFSRGYGWAWGEYMVGEATLEEIEGSLGVNPDNDRHPFTVGVLRATADIERLIEVPAVDRGKRDARAHELWYGLPSVPGAGWFGDQCLPQKNRPELFDNSHYRK